MTVPSDTVPALDKLIHPDLSSGQNEAPVNQDGERLHHAEGTSQPLRPRQSEAQRLWDLRRKRDAQMHAIPEWEELRELASQIKQHTLSHLDQYLEQFEANAKANGIHVHWAVDGAAHNHIVHGILRDHGAKSLIKSKSMLTEECGFRHYMAGTGIEVIDPWRETSS